MFLSLLALPELLALARLLVAMAAHQPSLASPLLAVAVVGRLVELRAVDLAALVAVAHTPRAHLV